MDHAKGTPATSKPSGIQVSPWNSKPFSTHLSHQPKRSHGKISGYCTFARYYWTCDLSHFTLGRRKSRLPEPIPNLDRVLLRPAPHANHPGPRRLSPKEVCHHYLVPRAGELTHIGHWVFTTPIQGCMERAKIVFLIRNIRRSGDKSRYKLEGETAWTVPER